MVMSDLILQHSESSLDLVGYEIPNIANLFVEFVQQIDEFWWYIENLVSLRRTRCRNG
jgi:hypothetical protein